MERSYRLHGFIVTLLFHAGLLLLFFFFYLTTPNPPLSSFSGGGIELNIGEMDAGTGDPSNMLPTNPEPTEENLVAAAATENNESEEENNEETEKDDINPVKDETAVPVKTEKEPKKNNSTTTENKTVTKATTTTQTNQINKNAILNANNKKAGDDLNKAGNPGNPKGLDERGLMKDGNPGFGNDPKGTGGIGSANVPGWKLSSTPNPKDESDESGTIIYEIWVNADGEVIKATPLERRGISLTTEKIYRDDVMKQLFERIDKSPIPSISKGPFTYTIKAK